MAISVTHTFVSPVADAGNPDEVGPNEWNAAHTISGLGTAAEADSTDFATAAQGALADSAVQPGDVDALVSANADVAANTAARHAAVTVTDSAEINFTLAGQDITASLVAGSIDESKLDTSVNASLDLADSAVQPAAIANMLETADIGVSVQAYSANLDEYAAVNPSAFGLARVGDAAAEDARNALDTAPYVATRAALKALAPAKDLAAWLTEAGRDGLFVLKAGSAPYADTQEGVFVTSNTAGFYWERESYRITGVAPSWFGAIESDPAQSITGFNAAWTFSRVAGVPLIVPVGTWYGRGLALYSNQRIIGMDMFRSIIKKPDAANTDDVIFGQDSYSLFGTTPANPDIVGSHLWEISGLTIDGNYRTNGSAGNGLATWGRRWTLMDVAFYDTGSHGLYTEFTDTAATFGMESVVGNIVIDTTRFHGWLNKGPHDMHVDTVAIIDVSQDTTNTYDGLIVDTGGNGRFDTVHVWQRGATTKRARYAINITATAGLSSFTNSHAEGAYSANLMCAQPYCSFDSTCGFYSAWNGVNVVLKASNIILRGWLGPPGSGRPNSLGVKLGEGSGDAVTGCLVDVVAISQDAGELDVTYSDGGNTLRVTGSSSAAAHVVGLAAMPITDHLILNTGGSVLQRDMYNGGSLFLQADAGVSTVARGFLTGVGSGALQLQRGRGTAASPAAVQSGDRLGAITFGGQYDTTVSHMANAAAVIGYAAENFSGSAQGGRIAFETIPNGSTTRAERWGVEQNGMLKATSGSLSRGAPVTKSADFTVADNETWLLNNKGSACVVTLPSAASFPGRELHLTNIGGAFALTSASSNVVPKAGGAAGTAILAATDGVWATLVSDGTNWIIMQAGT